MDELMDLSSRKTNVNSLQNNTLDELPAHVMRPSYDRKKMSPGIVHIGVGNFHRAHLAWYVHRLMQQGHALDWAIIGAGVREHDSVMREKLLGQDCLTTLIELDPLGAQATEVTGAMLDFLPVAPDNKPLIQTMADPRIRIVTTTITEGGYYLDPVTNGLDITHADIIHDAENPDCPRTAFGAIVAALRLRRDSGIGPFTGLSCDNLQANGTILRQSVVGLARLSDHDLADWIDSHCSFPNSMVDCIVPATGPAELQRARSLGIDDAAPVTHENFRQWVIEDTFCTGRPDWTLVGAEFSDHVHQYEARKIRVLNGGHQVLANAAEILGVDNISDAMAHPLIHAMFRKVLTEEIIPHVDPLPDSPVIEYLDLIDRRFANDSIIDTVRRVAFDGSARHVGFILPTIRDALKSGQSIEGLALIEALWARMCLGTRENGSQIAANDPIWETLTIKAADAQQNPSVWLEMQQIYGDLSQHARFADAFGRWLLCIYQNGVEATIRIYTEQN
jgi:mannitol 2-dehydrogenase